MSGSAADPVKLDPWQHVVEVGWPNEGGIPGVSISGTVYQWTGDGTCGGGAEDFNRDLHATGYLTLSEVSYNAGAEGGVYSIAPPGGGPFVNCTLSNAFGTVSSAFSDWTYSRSTANPIECAIAADGSSARIVVTNASELDQAPQCRNRLFGLGAVMSAAYLTPGAEVSVDGALVSLAGITFTEIGGLGRVFHPVSLTLVSSGGSGFFPFALYNLILG